MSFKDMYPEYEEVSEYDRSGEKTETVFYVVKMVVGGRDEDGEFLLVLDGPAEGERCYLNG